MSLSSPEASLCCGEAGKKEKDSARGTMGKGKREESPLPYDLRFSGRICGSVVLAKPADYLDAFERCCEDNSLKGFSILFHGFFTIHVFGAVVRHLAPFPSSHRPPRAFYFFDYCYSYRDTQLEPLRRREIWCPFCSPWRTHTGHQIMVFLIAHPYHRGCVFTGTILSQFWLDRAGKVRK